MLLSSVDRERIEATVREVEAKTRGEIVCVVAEEASDYSEVPLIWAAAIALAAPSIPLTFLSVIITVRQAFFGWESTEWLSAQSLVLGMAMLASMQFALFVIFALLAFIPDVRRFLTPGFLKHRYVRQRACEQFIAKGMTGTGDRAGILIYASLGDRCAELIADKGIDAKVGKAAWERTVETLVSAIKQGRTAEGFIAAVRDCGDKLAEHFPARVRNPNELADSVTQLPSAPRQLTSP
jgi:putative membrane protein